ncbi:MAG: cytochrome c maturation protein CcmE [ANME-2 cluster archaeon]|jgi:cytochrome c-type biogenesis protein CcmE|nr:cytochrome c maturation protein CcmE [ANME-2 cluster archaeon]
MDLDKRTLLGILTILFCIALGYSAINNYLVHYETVGDVLAHPPTGDVRVSGKLASEPTSNGATYNFQITDGNATMDVIFKGNLPSSFSLDSDVVVQGKLGEDHVFRAVTVITKCPSKFEV